MKMNLTSTGSSSSPRVRMLQLYVLHLFPRIPEAPRGRGCQAAQKITSELNKVFAFAQPRPGRLNI